MIHLEPHPLAGRTVAFSDGVRDLSGELVAGSDFRVEDYFDRVLGGSWMNANGHPAAMKFAMRTGLAGVGAVPLDDEVLYGKTKDGLGHLVHVSELASPSSSSA